MEIKKRKEIYLECCFPKSHNVKELDLNELFIKVDEIIERVETICNHGNKRDMRFRNQLLKDLESLQGIKNNGGKNNG